MLSVLLGMLLCVGLALAVLALVAVPARRQGRDVLSERGEQVIESIRERQLRADAANDGGGPAAGGAPDELPTQASHDRLTRRDDVVGALG
ncbi:MAG: hypothetical protein K0R30_2653 [Ornithinibacter sp.]|jgi:hypothetical protein|nr:hypothetical protein [Ornithinibacter sp.]